MYYHLLGNNKIKILYKISGMKFSSLELKLSGFAVKPPSMKGLIQNTNHRIIPLNGIKNYFFYINVFIILIISLKIDKNGNNKKILEIIKKSINF